MHSSSTTTGSVRRVLMLLAPHQPIISPLPTTSSRVQSQAPLAMLQKRFMRSSSSRTNSQTVYLGKLAILPRRFCSMRASTIPDSFACLAKMEILVLDDNLLSGVVLEMVCKIPTLLKLSLAKNYFTQVEKECRNLIKKGVLDVTNNCILDLEDQRSNSECDKFFSKQSRNCPKERLHRHICTDQYSSEKKLEHQGKAHAPLSCGSLNHIIHDFVDSSKQMTGGPVADLPLGLKVF